jgi:hypothetical protein
MKGVSMTKHHVPNPEDIQDPHLALLAQGILAVVHNIWKADSLLPQDDQSPLDVLRAAASAWVDYAIGLDVPGRDDLKIDLLIPVEAFKGLVLAEAVSRFPNDPEAMKKAFLLFGKKSTVASRNHWAMYERELTKVGALYKMFDRAWPEPDTTPTK